MSTLIKPNQNRPGVPRETPKRPIRIAVIGAGRWGQNILRVLSENGSAELVAACDQNLSTLCQLEANLKREVLAERVFDRDDVDAVAVATPPRTHAGLALAALRSGKHVFVEKPMAMRAGDALRIQRTAVEVGRRVMVGFILHHHPAVIALRSLVRSGRLGQLESIRAVRAAGRTPTTDHPIWWSLAPHDTSLALSLVGLRPRSISVSRSPSDTHETLRAVLGFSSPVRVELEVTSRPSKRQLIVRGALGEAVFDDLAPLPEKLTLSQPQGGATTPVPLKTAEPLATEFEHFLSCLASGRPFEPELEHAIDVVSVLEAGQRSFQDDGATVVVTPWRSQAAHGDASFALARS